MARLPDASAPNHGSLVQDDDGGAAVVLLDADIAGRRMWRRSVIPKTSAGVGPLV